MRKEFFRILFIEILLLVISFVVFIAIKKFNIVTYSLILLIPLFISLLLLGYSKRREKSIKDVLLVILISTIGYYLVTYGIGYFTGFLKTTYNHTIIGIVHNVLTILMFIFICEIQRYIIVKKCKYDRKYLLIILVIVMSFVELVTKGTFNSINSNRDILSLIIDFLPIFSKNILLTYIAYTSSIFNSLVYRCIMDIPIFIIPIIPNFGNYIYDVILVLFPMMVLFGIKKDVFYKREKIENSREDIKNRRIDRVSAVILIIFFIIVISLVSGLFRYYALTVGSPSMSGTIEVGDVVIIDKKNKNYKKGDIVAFRYEDKIIIHRVYEVYEDYYLTKGDNNKDADEWHVNKEDLVGKYCFKVKCLGWPTIKLNEWIMDGE